MGDQSLDGYRLDELERKVNGLQEHQVSREWLEERIGRLQDGIDACRDDVRTMKDTDRQRRIGVQVAVVGSILSMVSALIIAAISTGTIT